MSIKISGLTSGTTPDGTEEIPAVQGAATVKLTTSQMPVSTAQRTALDAKPNRNLLINGNPIINQLGYVSGTATTGANEYTLDMWRVVTSGQHLTFSETANVVTMTLPAGGVENVINGDDIQSGTHVISFTATGDTVCTVDGTTRASGDTFTLTGGTNATVKFSSAAGTGTVKLIQVEAGSDVSSFEHRKKSTELKLCQYYYIELGMGFVGTWISATQVQLMGFYPRMRITPTPILLTTTPVVTEIATADRTGSGSTIIGSGLDGSGCWLQIDGFTGATGGNGAASNQLNFIGLNARF